MGSTDTSEPSKSPVRRGRRSWYLAAAAGVLAVVAVAAISVAALADSDSPDEDGDAPALRLSLGDGDAMASCIRFDTSILGEMPMAFEGTVTNVDGEQVTLSVDRWYRGGDAATVELFAAAGMQALIGGIDFVEGQQYLVSATDGNVNYCGFSGPSTVEYRAAFEEAFAS